jgi:hypothetical protein
MAKEKNIVLQRKKEGRGKLLTALLILEEIGLLISIASFKGEILNPQLMVRRASLIYHTLSIVFVLYLIAGIVADIVIILGILQWKKLLVYISFILRAVLGIFGYFMYFSALGFLLKNQSFIPTLVVVTDLLTILLVILCIWIFKRKWHLFT